MERRRRRCREEWRELTARWRESGQTGVEFSLQEGLNPGTFAWWRSELGKEERVTPLTLVSVRNPVVRPRLELLEVLLPSGLTIRVPDSADRHRTVELIGLLLES